MDCRDSNGAIAAFEKSNASKSQIPRMMLSNQEDLRNYISTSDSETKKWWAQNAESHGDTDAAIKIYKDIDDVFSLVRTYCRIDEMTRVIESCS